MIENKKIIAYELNEVPSRVLDFFVNARPASALAKLVSRSSYYHTYSPDVGQLAPWSTWATQHRGVNNEQHGIFDLGQDLSGVDQSYPPIWSILSQHRVRTGVFGSLNSYPLPEELSGYTFYVPDTFAAGPECFPEALRVFQDFNLRMVDLSGRNVSGSVALKPALNLICQAPRLGIRGPMLLRLAKQLGHEWINRARKGRRRTSQVQLAFDLYLKQIKTTKPDYTSFFTNHVASAMHRYWPATFPEDYQEKALSDDWLRLFGGEILYAMGEASRQIGELAAFVNRHRDEHYMLMISSSMGQAAVDNEEIIRKQLYLQDHRPFFARLGIQPDQVAKKRAMKPRCVFSVHPDIADHLRGQLDRMTINGEKLIFQEHENHVFMMKLGQCNLDDDAIEVRLGDEAVNYREMGMQNTPIEDETGSYAYHIPEGVMVLYNPESPRATRVNTPVPTTEIAPVILRNFSLDVPAYMGAA